jgi:hypothetical protein
VGRVAGLGRDVIDFLRPLVGEPNEIRDQNMRNFGFIYQKCKKVKLYRIIASVLKIVLC